MLILSSALSVSSHSVSLPVWSKKEKESCWCWPIHVTFNLNQLRNRAESEKKNYFFKYFSLSISGALFVNSSTIIIWSNVGADGAWMKGRMNEWADPTRFEKKRSNMNQMAQFCSQITKISQKWLKMALSHTGRLPLSGSTLLTLVPQFWTTQKVC